MGLGLWLRLVAQGWPSIQWLTLNTLQRHSGPTEALQCQKWASWAAQVPVVSEDEAD